MGFLILLSILPALVQANPFDRRDGPALSALSKLPPYSATADCSLYLASTVITYSTVDFPSVTTTADAFTTTKVVSASPLTVITSTETAFDYASVYATTTGTRTITSPTVTATSTSTVYRTTFTTVVPVTSTDTNSIETIPVPTYVATTTSTLTSVVPTTTYANPRPKSLQDFSDAEAKAACSSFIGAPIATPISVHHIIGHSITLTNYLTTVTATSTVSTTTKYEVTTSYYTFTFSSTPAAITTVRSGNTTTTSYEYISTTTFTDKTVVATAHLTVTNSAITAPATSTVFKTATATSTRSVAAQCTPEVQGSFGVRYASWDFTTQNVPGVTSFSDCCDKCYSTQNCGIYDFQAFGKPESWCKLRIARSASTKVTNQCPNGQVVARLSDPVGGENYGRGPCWETLPKEEWEPNTDQ